MVLAKKLGVLAVAASVSAAASRLVATEVMGPGEVDPEPPPLSPWAPSRAGGVAVA